MNQDPADKNANLKWFSKDIGGKLDASESYDHIKSLFFTAWVSAGRPEGMAIFEFYDNTFDIVTLYFTPSAKELAEYLKATPCEKPPISIGLTMIVGCYGGLEHHYPSS